MSEARDPREMTEAELRALGHEPMPVLDALRARCLDCCAGSPHEVRACAAVRCPAWPYRMGFNPWRKRQEISEEARAERGRRLERARAVRAEKLLGDSE